MENKWNKYCYVISANDMHDICSIMFNIDWHREQHPHVINNSQLLEKLEELSVNILSYGEKSGQFYPNSVLFKKKRIECIGKNKYGKKANC